MSLGNVRLMSVSVKIKTKIRKKSGKNRKGKGKGWLGGINLQTVQPEWTLTN